MKQKLMFFMLAFGLMVALVFPASAQNNKMRFEEAYIEVMAINQSVNDLLDSPEQFMNEVCGKKTSLSNAEATNAAVTVYANFIKTRLDGTKASWQEQDAPFLNELRQAVYGRQEIYQAKQDRPLMNYYELNGRLEGSDRHIAGVLRAARHVLDLPTESEFQKAIKAADNKTNMTVLCHD